MKYNIESEKTQKMKCAYCNGKGRIMRYNENMTEVNEENCPKCWGDGYIEIVIFDDYIQ